ncbi:hypothetical protein C0585_00265 [Candidatus Woesearchaeota archaeon]|nr:MAG: hypothetical protein C0585_00265 [Candidatus Woesearchaeota archaeon]
MRKRKDYKEILEHFFKNRTNRILSIIFVLLIVCFFTLMKDAFIIFMLIFLAWIIKFYQRYVNIEFGFDLTLFACIITSYSYGAFIGIFTGFASLFLATSWNGRYTPSVLFGFFLIFCISLIVPKLNLISITSIGIFFAILYDIIQATIYLVFFGGKIHKAAIFALTHTSFNIWAFLVVAPKFISIM